MPTNFKPLLVPEARWIDELGRPTNDYYDYIRKLDAIIRKGAFGPLTNAANDGAAATAGVQIGGLYRNGNAVQIRLT